MTLPTRLFQCLPEPTPPILNEDTQDSQIALFIKDLAYAGRDCRDQLAEIGETLDLQPDIEISDIVVEQPEEPKKRSRFGLW